MIHRLSGLRTLVAAGLILGGLGAAHAATTPEQKCLAGRAKAAGAFNSCIQKWFAGVYAGKPTDLVKLAKCRIKYAGAWTKLQKLTGTTCDASRFVDNGDGTVTDNLTGLVWEKKTTAVGSGTNPSDRDDVDNRYTWTDGDPDYTDEDGSLFTDYLANLNSDGLGGANGWRLPSFAELQTILLPETYPCSSNPCIDATFGATPSYYYWSATTNALYHQFSWRIDFAGSYADYDQKIYDFHVRAVRGGL